MATPTPTSPPCPPWPFDDALPDPNVPANYIGRHLDFHKLPAGLEYMGGWVVRDDFAVEYVRWDDSMMIWLTETVCRDAHQAYKEIHDVVVAPVPDYEAHEDLTSHCHLNGVDQGAEVFAIGVYDFSTGHFDPIYHAWRANLQSGSFEELPLEGLDCYSEMIGP